MALTYEPITSTTLGSAQTTVDFTSISSSYTDLMIVATFSFVAAKSLSIRFNSDSGNNYSNTQLTGNGTSASSVRNSNNPYMYLAAGQTSLGTAILHFQNYSNTTTYKTVLARQGTPGTDVTANVGLWRSTAAITSISLSGEGTSNNIASGSTFTLYGIKAA